MSVDQPHRRAFLKSALSIAGHAGFGAFVGGTSRVTSPNSSKDATAKDLANDPAFEGLTPDQISALADKYGPSVLKSAAIGAGVFAAIGFGRELESHIADLPFGVTPKTKSETPNIAHNTNTNTPDDLTP